MEKNIQNGYNNGYNFYILMIVKRLYKKSLKMHFCIIEKCNK